MSLLGFELKARADCIGVGLQIEQLARSYGWPAVEAGEVKLIVVELCANAVRHAEGGHCEIHIDERGMQIKVRDQGAGLPPKILEGHFEGLPRKSGLGAGLACAKRLSNELFLTNPPEGGAQVIARRVRRSRGE